MGLSGRKVKQRIPEDPRNLSWADNAARFGSSYLAKFGWDASKGLGASGDGRTSHVKVSQKLDMLGIGAAHQMDPNGIAWKQNKEFENLLKRLNAANENEPASAEVVHATSEEMEGTAREEEENKKTKETHGDKKEKKRKRSKDKSGEPEEKESKKPKTEDGKTSASCTEPQVEEPTPPPALKPRVPRHRAHRARVIAAKNIASKSATAISEILGVAPSTSSSALSSGVATPTGKLTSMYDDEEMQMEKITTSTKSVADYFKEKLLAKSTSRSESSAPMVSAADESEADYAPRGGLGSSRVRFEVQETTELETERTGIGLSKFSSLMSSSFLATASSIVTATESELDRPETSKELDQLLTENSSEDDDIDRTAKRKGKDEREKRKEKKKGKDKESGEERKKKKSKKKDKEKEKKSAGDIVDEDEELGIKRNHSRDAGEIAAGIESSSVDEEAEKRRRKQERKEKKARKRKSEVKE